MELKRVDRPLDRLGNEIKEGDIICYPITYSSYLRVRVGKVTFAHKDYVDATIKVDTWKGTHTRAVKITRFDRIVVIPPIQLSKEDREYFEVTAIVEDKELDEVLSMMHSKECDPHCTNCSILREKVKALLQRKYIK